MPPNNLLKNFLPAFALFRDGAETGKCGYIQSAGGHSVVVTREAGLGQDRLYGAIKIRNGAASCGRRSLPRNLGL